MGPRFLVRAAGLEMHPIDQADRREYLKDDGGIGYCNITKCCTEVCPEHIKITDNAIIPLKERVADEYYDPLQMGVAQAPRRRRAVGQPGRAAGPPGPGRTVPTEPPTERHACPELTAECGAAGRGGRTVARVRHPDRRRGPRQPRAGLGRGGALSTCAAPTPATRGRARTPRSPTTSASRPTTSPSTPGVVRALELARELGAPRGPPAARLEAHRRAARRPLAGQGRQAHPALGGGPPDAGRVRPLVRRPRAARPELASRTRSPTRRSTGPRPAARPRSCAGRGPEATTDDRTRTAATRPGQLAARPSDPLGRASVGNLSAFVRDDAWRSSSSSRWSSRSCSLSSDAGRRRGVRPGVGARLGRGARSWRGLVAG